jgi:hypothetical protein
MSSFSLSVRRSSVCFTVSNGEKQTSCHHYVQTMRMMTWRLFLPIRDSKTYRRTTYRQWEWWHDVCFSPLETVKHTDERRTCLYVLLSLMGKKQTSCHHSHFLYVVRPYVLLFPMDENQTSCHHSHCLYVVSIVVLPQLWQYALLTYDVQKMRKVIWRFFLPHYRQ